MNTLKSLAALCVAACVIAAGAAYAQGPDAKTETPAADASAEKSADTAPAVKLETHEDKLSYLIGSDVGTNLKQNGVAVVRERFLLGFRDVTAGKQPAMTDPEIASVFEKYRAQRANITTQEEAEKPVTGDETFLGQLSYIFGADAAELLRRNDLVVSEDIFMRGIEDVANGRELALSKEEMQQVVATHKQKLMEKRKALGDKNLAEGKAFLEANAAKPGVITTESGLQYLVVAKGNGATPKAGDTVRTHYRGTLIDGTEFDSSYARNEPIEFPVSGVIPGWTEALQLMHVGDKWKLFIPSDLAYGERGAPPSIGPNATLIFDIELLDVLSGEQPATDGTIKLEPDATETKQ